MNSLMGQRIKTLRKDRELTQDELAMHLNEQFNLCVNKSMISKWENGKGDPLLSYAKLLAAYFNVNLDYLVGLSDLKNSFCEPDNFHSAEPHYTCPSKRERNLCTMFCTLNNFGQDRVLEYVNDICVGGRYFKTNEDASESTSYTIVDELNDKNKIIEELKKEIAELKDYIDDLESGDLSCRGTDELITELESRGYGADWDDF